ncbi:LytTR family DNA-binding domain-containing protein [Sphingobacterium sp. lm-10]|uniref:LytR/AlgR family response regulator transcription factor n=1 Tax=Sphingobacterium sp. lm-10 TaxID=2944904 RepID=UPI00202131F5|nr:LytTR family DNA-binding domain-containing protein [Sphingobacterium sp. lm-10]MCL7986650.1 LytTR family DNA-binding domain-containing protein [Sphingobacterium sp. lm-10]
MNILKCIIVDDEEGGHRVLEHFIGQVRYLNLSISIFNTVEAMEYIYNNEVDLVFLDINMPGLTGMEMLETMSNRPFVILTTAYEEYALEAYKYDVIDYLLKPFDFKRFLSAIDKVVNRLEGKSVEKQASIDLEDIVLKVNNEILKIPFNSILYTQSCGNYVKFFTANKMFISQIRTQEVEAKLNPKHFIRIHKSYLVATREIYKITGGELYLRDGTILPIGKFYKKNVIDTIKN